MAETSGGSLKTHRLTKSAASDLGLKVCGLSNLRLCGCLWFGCAWRPKIWVRVLCFLCLVSKHKKILLNVCVL